MLVAVPVTHPGHEFERGLWSNVTKGFELNTTITGTTLASVWTPTGSKKFVLKGFELTAVVRTVFAAANVRILTFYDNSTAAVVCSAGMAFQATADVGTFFSTPGVVWLREGVMSATATNVLKLGFNGDISTGVLAVAGVCFGEEV